MSGFWVGVNSGGGFKTREVSMKVEYQIEKKESFQRKTNEFVRADTKNEIEIDVVPEEDDNRIGLDLNFLVWVICCEEERYIKFDEESPFSHFRKSSTEEVENKHEDSFEHNKEIVTELRSETVFR